MHYLDIFFICLNDLVPTGTVLYRYARKAKVAPELSFTLFDNMAWVSFLLALTLHVSNSVTGKVAYQGRHCSVSIIIAPNGDDNTGDGTKARPFATLNRARSRVRELSASHGDICILLRGGSYPLNSTFVLVPADGGNSNRTIVYSSYTDEQAVIEGGRRLSGWTASESVGGPPVWSAPLHATEVGGFVPRQMWIGADRVNESGLVAANSVFGSNTLLSSDDTVITASGYITNNSAVVAAAAAHDAACKAAATQSCVADVEFVYRRTRVQWEEDRLRVMSWTRLSSGALNISFPSEGWKLRLRYTNGGDFPTSIINLYPTLTKPGTGYVSGASNRVFYVPRPGDNLTSLPPVWVPSFDGPLISVRGERNAIVNKTNPAHPPHFVEKISFLGLTLKHATWGYPSGPAGYIDQQGGILEGGRPAVSAWELKTVRDVNIHRCVVAHVGGGGLAVDEGSDGVSITDSLFLDTSCWGIRLGQTNDSGTPFGDWELRRTQNLTVRNSVILQSGVELRGCPGIMGGYLRDSTIAQNTISQSQWGGITIGWGWTAPATLALGRNRIVGNKITHTNLATADGGPIYVLGTQGAGQSEMTGNFVGHAPHKCSFLYHDEGSTNWWTHDNVVDMPASDMPAICRNDFKCDAMPGHFDYLAAWASSEHNITVERVFTRGLNQTNVYKGNNITVRTQTMLATGEAWPAAAQAIVNGAGARLNLSVIGRGESYTFSAK